MPWFKVDDKLHDHRKPRAAKKAAMGVWVLAGSWAADNLTDGFVPANVLTRWGTPRDAAALVAAGLWHADVVNGERGWRFHDWSEFQPTRAEKEAEREARREAGRRGGINSGRSRREAKPKQSASQVASGGLEAKTNPRPDPVPTVGSKSYQSPLLQLDDDGLTRVEQITKGDRSHAQRTATMILDRVPPTAFVRDPTAYVLAAIRDDPDAYRYRRGNPTKFTECPQHPGQWPDTCSGCAADQLVDQETA